MKAIGGADPWDVQVTDEPTGSGQAASEAQAPGTPEDARVRDMDVGQRELTREPVGVDDF